MKQGHIFFRNVIILAALVATGLPAALAQRAAQLPPSQAQVAVHVQEAGGGPIGQAEVRLLSVNSPGGLVQTIGVGGAANFSSMEGNYTVEVRAAGYQTAREEIMVLGSQTTHCFITMRREDGSTPQKVSEKQGVPELRGKSRNELDDAMAALGHNKLAEAQKHVAYLLKHAGGHPDVQYIAALCAFAANDIAGARDHLQTTVTLFPRHFGAQTALAGLLLQDGKTDDAISHLDKALAAEPNAWRAHRLLAEAYLRANRDFDKAKFHAAKALELGKEKATGVEITLALAEAASGGRDAGRARLEGFLRDNPAHPDAARARTLLTNAIFSPRNEGVLQPVVATATVTAPAASVFTDVPTGPIRHLPSAVDAAVPIVEQGVSCALPQVLQGAALRAGEFTDALERFSATETFLHDELDANGAVRKSYNDSFQYLATLKWPRPDLMILTEMRNGRTSVSNLPVPFVTEGVPSIGLVFHSAHAPNFLFACEGLGHWHGQPAWQVRFEQRLDRPAQIHDWAEKGQVYPAILKGRAWISAGAYHLLRVETDLVKPIPEVRLELHHMTIEYAPVKSNDGTKELWLPSYAEVYSRFRGRFFRQQHDFGDFTLFSVNSDEKIKDPDKR
jgi:tetratricopeptide (TPR) repeat protein